MLPKYHLILGALFSLIIFWLFPTIKLYNILLIFFSSFLVDTDHYLIYVLKKRDLNLRRAHRWNVLERMKARKYLHYFHTIEFFILIFIFSLFANFFLFILIGVLFHFIVDAIDMVSRKILRAREFSIMRYILVNKKG